MYPKKKLRSSLFLIALIFAFLFSLYLIRNNAPQEQFARFSDSYLKSAYENDSLSLHFTLTDPSAFGIDPAVCSLPCYDRETYLAEGENLQKLRRTLSGISPAHLPAHTRETYEILTAYLEKSRKVQTFLILMNPSVRPVESTPPFLFCLQNTAWKRKRMLNPIWHFCP